MRVALVALLLAAVGCARSPLAPPDPEVVAALRAETVELVAAQPPAVVLEVVARETAGTIYSRTDLDASVTGQITVEPFRDDASDASGSRVRAVQSHPVGVRTLSPTPFEILGRVAARLAETDSPRTLFDAQWTDAASDREVCRTSLASVFERMPGVDGAPEDVVESPPELIGGMQALASAVVYPELDRRLGVEGRALVQFVVGPEGVPECIRTIAAPSAGTAEAAMAAVRGVRFRPGTQRGQPVRVRFMLPVNFVLN